MKNCLLQPELMKLVSMATRFHAICERLMFAPNFSASASAKTVVGFVALADSLQDVVCQLNLRHAATCRCCIQS